MIKVFSDLRKFSQVNIRFQSMCLSFAGNRILTKLMLKMIRARNTFSNKLVIKCHMNPLTLSISLSRKVREVKLTRREFKRERTSNSVLTKEVVTLWIQTLAINLIKRNSLLILAVKAIRQFNLSQLISKLKDRFYWRMKVKCLMLRCSFSQPKINLRLMSWN